MVHVHIGDLLTNYYNRKRIYKSVLARKTGIDYQ